MEKLGINSSIFIFHGVGVAMAAARRGSRRSRTWFSFPARSCSSGYSYGESSQQMQQHYERQFAAVFVCNDPVDWGRDLQERRIENLPNPTLFFAADDFEFPTKFPVPRFGMGALRIILEKTLHKTHRPVRAGRPWFSILVQWQNFQGDGNYDMFPAAKVVDDVYEAVDLILQREGIGTSYQRRLLFSSYQETGFIDLDSHTI